MSAIKTNFKVQNRNLLANNHKKGGRISRHYLKGGNPFGLPLFSYSPTITKSGRISRHYLKGGRTSRHYLKGGRISRHYLKGGRISARNFVYWSAAIFFLESYRLLDWCSSSIAADVISLVEVAHGGRFNSSSTFLIHGICSTSASRDRILTS